MQRLRRIVTTFMSLALLQLTVLGTSLTCATMAADAPRTAHGQHDAASASADAALDSGAPTHELPNDADCLVRACASTPIALPVHEIALDPVELPVRTESRPDQRPASPIQTLDPPPPRA